MNLKSFLKLIELPTKITCITTLIAASVYVIYKGETFNYINFLYMFISLVTMDMVTTGLNNYLDYKKARKKIGFGYEEHNAIVKYNLKESTVIITLLILTLISAFFGILLYLNTDIIVLLIGILSFGIGILYTFGPIPISRTAFGEVFSGFFQGFVIIFLGIYIHTYNQGWVVLELISDTLSIKLNIKEIIYIFLFSLPSTFTIANIMLANNICDIEDDIENKRYTLPIFIGKEKALTLFKYIYFICYLDIIILAILKIAPILVILSLLTFIIVNKNIKTFYDLQTKKDTFPLAIMNFIVINFSFIISIAASTLIHSV